MNFSIKEVKKFFFDRQAVIRALDPWTHAVLSRAGAYIRRTAKLSIKRAKPYTSIAAMPKHVRQRYYRAIFYCRKKGLPPPRPPLRHSKPGQPPLSHTGLLKDNIFFDFDLSRHQLLVGPAIIPHPTGAPRVLEFGGINNKGHYVEKRPYMGPALMKNLHIIPASMRQSAGVFGK